MYMKIRKIIKGMKKYKVQIFIELMVILVCSSMMSSVYIGHKNLVQERITNALEECKKELRDYQYTHERAYPIDIVHFFEGIIAREDNTLQMMQDGSEMGIALELYDKDGKLILSNHSDFSYIEIFLRNTEEQGDISECLMLSEFFTDEQLREFRDNWRKHDDWNLKKITGYYENDRFIIVRIVLCDENIEDVYEIVNEDAEQKVEREDIQCIERYSNRWKEDNVGEYLTTEEKYRRFTRPLDKDNLGAYQTGEWMNVTSVSLLKCLDRSTKAANQLFYSAYGSNMGKDFLEDKDYYYCYEDDNVVVETIHIDEELPGNVVYGAYAIYADVNYLVWGSTTVKIDIIEIFISCQVFGIALMILLNAYEKKRKELKNLKNTFINAIAHEMKTPAAVIMNTSECILEEVHPEKRERYQKIVFQEAEHISKLISSMLIYTRINDFEYKLKKEPMVLNEITNDILEHFKTLIENKQIHLLVKEQGIFEMKGDRKLMEMVIDNYISNAVKYCTFGGNIIISISEEKLKVYNDGEHISHSMMQEIWEPLFQKDESRGQESDCAGMGLAISASILKLHGLGYNVGNEEKGVEFVIYKKFIR